MRCMLIMRGSVGGTLVLHMVGWAVQVLLLLLSVVLLHL